MLISAMKVDQVGPGATQEFLPILKADQCFEHCTLTEQDGGLCENQEGPLVGHRRNMPIVDAIAINK